MPNSLAELAVLSERVTQLRDAVKEVKPLREDVIRLEGRMDALEAAQERGKEARTTYENKVEAALKKTDDLEERDKEIENKIELERWKFFSYLALASGSGGTIVGAFFKYLGG